MMLGRFAAVCEMCGRSWQASYMPPAPARGRPVRDRQTRTVFWVGAGRVPPHWAEAACPSCGHVVRAACAATAARHGPEPEPDPVSVPVWSPRQRILRTIRGLA